MSQTLKSWKSSSAAPYRLLFCPTLVNMHPCQTRLLSCRRCAALILLLEPLRRRDCRQDSIKLSVCGRRAIDWQMELWRLPLARVHMWGARPLTVRVRGRSTDTAVVLLSALECFGVFMFSQRGNYLWLVKSAIMAAVKKCSVLARWSWFSFVSPAASTHHTNTHTISLHHGIFCCPCSF